MNRDRMEGQWREMKGKIKERWGKLTDDRLDQLEGRWDQLAGELQQRYGIAREEAERQVNDFRRSHESPPPRH